MPPALVRIVKTTHDCDCWLCPHASREFYTIFKYDMSVSSDGRPIRRVISASEGDARMSDAITFFRAVSK